MAIDKNKLYFQLATLLTLSLLPLFFTESAVAQLTIDPVERESGQRVVYNVTVANAPKKVNAFTMDISYDPKALKYAGYVQGDLTRTGYPLFGVNNREPGIVRIGGVGPQNPGIQSGSSGTIVQLQFDVISEGDSRIEFMKLMDDIRDWPATSGSFSNVPQEAGGASPQNSEAAGEIEDNELAATSQSASETNSLESEASIGKGSLSARSISPELQPLAETDAQYPTGFRLDGQGEGNSVNDSGGTAPQNLTRGKDSPGAEKAKPPSSQSGLKDLPNAFKNTSSHQKPLTQAPTVNGKQKQLLSPGLFSGDKKGFLSAQEFWRNGLFLFYQFISLVLQAAILVMLVLIYKRLNPRSRLRKDEVQAPTAAETPEPSAVVTPLRITKNR